MKLAEPNCNFYLYDYKTGSTTFPEDIYPEVIARKIFDQKTFAWIGFCTVLPMYLLLRFLKNSPQSGLNRGFFEKFEV
jgi:hypothetical protein